MKCTGLILITLVVGSLASPTLSSIFSNVKVYEVSNSPIDTGKIIQTIENIAQQIRDKGRDPFQRTLTVEYKLPVPVIFSANAVVNNFLLTGLSNIVVESMNYALLENKLTFSIVLPNIAASVDNCEGKVVVFGTELAGSISGRVSVNDVRISGDVYINVEDASSVSVRSLSLQFSLGGIESDLKINLLNTDLSSQVNALLLTTVPNTLNEFQSEINELVEAYSRNIITNILNRSITL